VSLSIQEQAIRLRGTRQKHLHAKRVWLLFVLTLAIYSMPLVYNALVMPFFRVIPSQDVVAASLVPTSILTRGNFYLDQYRRYIANNYAEQNFAVEKDKRLIANTPIVAGVLALPFVGWGLGSGWIIRTPDVFVLAKFAAAWITALAVIVFYFCASELTVRSRLFVTFAFAFGSAVWSTASQALWQHTPSILFQGLAFWFILRGVRRGREYLAPAGLFLTLAVLARPSNITTALIFALLVLVYSRRAFVLFVLWALPPLVLGLAYNVTIHGSPLIFGYHGELQRWSLPNPETLQGLLFSPSRGLFIFSPFLFLMPVGLWLGWQQKPRYFYVTLALVCVAYTLVMSSWGSLGGWAYGSRMLTDILPAACLLIIPAMDKIQGRARGFLWALVVLAAGVQTLGLEDYGIRFHSDPNNSVWSIENNEPLFYLRYYLDAIREWLGF